MKKLTVFVLALACTLSTAGCASLNGSRPYRDLSAEEISSATVCLTPPDKTLQIENIDELAELLKAVVIYEEDNSYTEYCGQGVAFTLTMADGSQTFWIIIRFLSLTVSDTGRNMNRARH